LQWVGANHQGIPACGWMALPSDYNSEDIGFWLEPPSTLSIQSDAR